MKKFLVFCAVCILLVSCSVLSVCAISPYKLNNYIETSDFYLYIPDQYTEYITFNESDEILYFSTTSTVNCLLVFKSGSLSDRLCSCQFSNVYQRNSTTLTYNTLLGYYQNQVSVLYSSGSSQQTLRIDPITRSDIIFTDIEFLNHDLVPFFILICCFSNLLLTLFFIFSKKRQRVV